MFLVFIFFWTIAIFLWIGEDRSRTTFWCGCALFFFGFGGLAAFISDAAGQYEWSRLPVAVCSSIMYFWGPFALLMYAMCYSGKMPRKTSSQLMLTQLFMLPAEAAYLVFPALTMFSRSVGDLRVPYTRIMTALMTPYFIMSCVLLLTSWYWEKDSAVREEKAVNSLLAVPSALGLFCTSYIIPSLGILNAWRLNAVIIILVSGMFLLFVIKKGALGLHIHKENLTRAQTRQAVIQSTGVLHHAVKNNLLTTRLALQNAQFHAEMPEGGEELLTKDIALAMDACEHTLAILDRIRLQFQPIQITPEMCSVLRILEQTADQSIMTYSNKKITIEKHWEYKPMLLCDPVHMHEALLNLVNNAAEAVSEDGSGRILIRTSSHQGKLIIQIADNGCGITKKQWGFIGTPLFTTKTGKNHFGLGLYYVQKVAELHGARFDLRSAATAGTIAELVFPAYRTGGEDSFGEKI